MADIQQGQIDVDTIFRNIKSLLQKYIHNGYHRLTKSEITQTFKLISMYYNSGKTLEQKTIDIICNNISGIWGFVDVLSDSIEYIKQLKPYNIKFTSDFLMCILITDVDVYNYIDQKNIDISFISKLDDKEYSNDIAEKIVSSGRFAELKLTQKWINAYISQYDKGNSTILYELLNNPGVKINESIKTHIMCKNNVKLFGLLLSHDVKISTELLNYIILNAKEYKYEKILFLLNNKVIPTNETFNNIVKSHNPQISFCGHIKRHININDNATILNLIIDYGYIPTYDDVKNALRRKLVINNIERFNIPFDHTYLGICAEVSIYPYKIDIEPDIKCLEKECDKPGNLSIIKKIIKKTNIKPNTTCIRNACKHRNNIQTIKFLVSKGAVIDFECLLGTIKSQYSAPLTYVCEEYLKNKALDCYDNKNDDDNINTDNIENTRSNDTDDTKTNVNEDVKVEQTKTIEPIQYVSNIPNTFKAYDNVYMNIPQKLLDILILSNTDTITFMEFRKKVLEYLYNNNKITQNGIHIIDNTFMFNGLDKFNLIDINEYVYGLLCFTEDTKTEENISEKRVRKKNSRASKTITDGKQITKTTTKKRVVKKVKN